MRKQTLIAATAAVFGAAFACSTAAMAQERVAVPMDSLESPFGPQAIVEGGGNYAEDFETFTVGPLVPQGGWSSDFDPNASVVDPGLAGSTRAALHSSDGSAFAGFEMRSPDFTPLRGYIEVTQVIEGTGSLYQMVPVDTVTGFFNTRINFETDGSITAGVVDMTGMALEFLPTTGSWTPGVETTIGVQVTDAGELLVFQDGTQIFAGTEVNFDLSGTAGEISALFSWSDNFGSTDTQTWDNIQLLAEPPAGLPESVPVPTNSPWALVLMMLALAGVGIVAVRRFA